MRLVKIWRFNGRGLWSLQESALRRWSRALRRALPTCILVTETKKKEKKKDAQTTFFIPYLRGHVEMEPPQELNTSLQIFPIPNRIRKQIQAVFWDGDEDSTDAVADDFKERPTPTTTVSTDYYFNAYYFPRCQYFAREGGRHITVRTHSDIARIADWILQDESRDAILSRLRVCQGKEGEEGQEVEQEEKQDTTANERAIETSVDMCASLLAMVECGKRQEFVFSGRSPLLWDSEGRARSLRNCLSRGFTAQTTLDARNSKLVKGFTGRNLSRIGGIKIKWTTNLVDHLLLTDDDQAVFVFQCASFLMLQKG